MNWPTIVVLVAAMAFVSAQANHEGFKRGETYGLCQAYRTIGVYEPQTVDPKLVAKCAKVQRP